ncbi:MAG: hypothetical protein ABSD99_02095 [Candidatus Bathyarchaeia archaeon]|jgi:hypothetical protein
MTAVRPEQMLKILEVTDSLNLHRESVTIPLSTEGEGSVTILADRRVRIVVPSNKRFEDWLKELRAQLAKMNLPTTHE